MLDPTSDDPIPPTLLSTLLQRPGVPPPFVEIEARVAPPEARTNLMAGDLVEINCASVEGRAWMSTVAPVMRVFERGARAELRSNPTRSEERIWVKLRLTGEDSTDTCYVAARHLDLVEARSHVPLTVVRPPTERNDGEATYISGDLIHTTVAVNLRAAPGARSSILRELGPNAVGAVHPGVERIGATDWVQIELPDITGWVATKHTELFARAEKWIEVDLSAQTLIAWNDRMEDRRLTISSGKPGFRTPLGTFSISRKIPARRTVATVNGEHWDIPGVPWVMVFRSGGYYFHGVYWHNDFGAAVSHGCVTLGVPDAEWLYEWTPPGAPVWIHG